MAEEVVKTIENVDHLFSEIIVNGEVHHSENYVPPAQQQIIPNQIIPEETSTAPIEQPTQDVGEDVYAVVLNDTKHDFVDPETVQNLSQEVVARQNVDNQLQQGITGLTGEVSSIQSKIPSEASSTNKLADKAFVETSISDVVSALDASSVGGNNKYIKSISEADGVISATEGSIDTTVTEGSNNPVTSDAVHDAIQESMGDSIKTYPTMTDLEQDLPNLEEGQIVATEEGDAFTTVDTVQSGVFNPVTSNAVARELATSANEIIDGDYKLTYYKWGKVVLAEIYASITLSGNDNVNFPFVLPEGIRPAYQVRVALVNNNNDSLCGQACFYTYGRITLWHQHNGGTDSNFRATFCYITS